MPLLRAQLPVLPDSEKLLEMGARIGLVVVVAFLVLQLARLLVGRFEHVLVRAGRESPHAFQRAKTIGQILRSLVAVLVIGEATIHSLGVLGWDVRPLLAGAGVLGLAIGFGAQTLVRDVIAGVFVLVEDQYAVGDLIEINGKVASVEAISVRSTTLRDFNGHLHFVPNGEMRVVTNRSRGWQRLAVDVPVASEEDLERALAVCRDVVARFNADSEWRPRLLDPIELWGIESLTPTEATIRLVVRAETGPNAPEAARELRRRAQQSLRVAGLRLATPREPVHMPLAAADAAGAHEPRRTTS